MAMTLLLGGAASGKSRSAAALAARTRLPVTVVATAEALDDEMAARIARHRRERPEGWSVIEEPLDLAGAADRARGATIVDCLTLWVSNMLGYDLGDEEIVVRAAAAAKACAARSEPTIVVSNEVGSGIVPVNLLARRYRDVLGRVNATFADEADVVALMVAGRAVRLSTMLTDLEEEP
jgi:adenosyl cobinamide kinase/adenosyl cobinamide phosphate guanylyltransferase